MAQARPGAAVAAVIFALLLLAPAVVSLQAAMEGLAEDLASGDFRPFGKGVGQDGTDPSRRVYDNAVGGLTGQSNGNFMAGALQVPDAWPMDRNGEPGRVTIDYVFDPALGAMKRFKAYDRIADDYALEVSDTRMQSPYGRTTAVLDETFHGSFPVRVNPEVPVPIFSPAPDALIVADSVRTDPPVPVKLLKDGTDTFHIVSEGYTGVIHLNLTYRAPSAYFSGHLPSGITPGDYPASERPSVPEGIRERAPLVLARAGLDGDEDLQTIVLQLGAYFRSFGEESIPDREEVPDLYEALALGENGCCRHRAFAFVATLHALGVPARMVVNEAHAYAEVKLPGANGGWRQVNLGGCGTYDVNNPQDADEYERLGPQAAQPQRGPGDRDEGPATTLVPTNITIDDYDQRMEKGAAFRVRGTVTGQFPDGHRPLDDTRVDVYLNRSKQDKGVLVATGRTNPLGEYEATGRIPENLVPGPYQLVARAQERRVQDTLFLEGWSDPQVEVWSDTRLTLEPLQREGLGVPVPIRGRLADAEGLGVAGAIVRLVVDGDAELELHTNGRGWFFTNLTFSSLGVHTLDARYTGDAYREPARATGTVEIVNATVTVDATETAILGETWTFNGRVLAGGRGVANAPVRLDARWLPEPVDVTTDADGRFTGTTPVPPDAPIGRNEVTFRAPGPDVQRNVVLEVLQGTSLRVHGPDHIRVDESFRLTAELLTGRPGQESVPVPGARLELTLDNQAAPLRAATDASGRATFTLDADDLPEGRHTWKITYPGGPDLGRTQATGTVQVGGLPGLDAAWVPWALGASAPLLLAATAYAVHRHRPGLRIPWAPLARRLAPPTVHAAAEATGDADGLPPVWAPDETARLRLRAHRVDDGREVPAAGLRVRARLGTHKWQLRLDDDGTAEVDLPDLPEGVHEIRLRGRGLRTRVEVRILPYGRAIDHAWREALRDARAADADVPPGATPRQLADALTRAGGNPGAAMVVADLFEAVEYGPGEATRHDWVRFVRALRHAKPRHRQPPGGGEAAG